MFIYIHILSYYKLFFYFNLSQSGLVWFMVFNATFNNFAVISWRSVLLVEETAVPREKKDM